MNDPRQWLTERAAQPGTLACGLRQPDGSFISHSVDAGFPTTAIESILNRSDILAGPDQTAPQWNTWAFEQGQIRLVERPDGWRLALVARNDSPVVLSLDLLSQEFLAIQFGT